MELRCRWISTDDRTSLDSFEVGRPFIESPHGWPVMIAWYAGLLRHEERGLQPDSWQLNGYLKAFYWGFPWSGRVRTRIGFGGRLSRAQRVALAGSWDQAARKRHTCAMLSLSCRTTHVPPSDRFG